MLTDVKGVSWAANDLPLFIERANIVYLKPRNSLNQRDLWELEDLYYATCAKVKEMLGAVNLLLSNGFMRPTDEYFRYGSVGLRHMPPVTLKGFKLQLLAQEQILLSDCIHGTMNKAIMRKNQYNMNRTSRPDYIPGFEISQYGPEHDRKIREALSLHRSGWLRPVEGLKDVQNMPSSLVFAGLMEKYGPILDKEKKQLAEKKEERKRLARAQAYKDLTANECPEVVHAQPQPPARYISPYNLDERAKRLNLPGGAEKPCICDPECICAPVCASDLTQNCLCEEHPLFVRVHEGWDIDDLYVPDRIPEEERTIPFGAMNNEIAQLMVAGLASPKSPTYAMAIEQLEQHVLSIDMSHPRRTQGFEPANQKTNRTSSAPTPASSGPQQWPKRHSSLGAPKMHIYKTDENYMPDPLFSHRREPTAVQDRPYFARRFIGALDTNTEDKMDVDDANLNEENGLGDLNVKKRKKHVTFDLEIHSPKRLDRKGSFSSEESTEGLLILPSRV